jgi:hypothetical protein
VGARALLFKSFRTRFARERGSVVDSLGRKSDSYSMGPGTGFASSSAGAPINPIWNFRFRSEALREQMDCKHRGPNRALYSNPSAHQRGPVRTSTRDPARRNPLRVERQPRQNHRLNALAAGTSTEAGQYAPGGSRRMLHSQFLPGRPLLKADSPGLTYRA